MQSHTLPVDRIPWAEIALPLAKAEDSLARLDERLAKSPISEGWASRTHFSEACASMWLEGELVHLEDLVLHDAHMDVRTPTPELTKAHTILRTRRRIAEAPPGWPLSPAGMEALLGQKPSYDNDRTTRQSDLTEGEGAGNPNSETDLTEAFAELDAAIERIDRAIARNLQQSGQPPKAHEAIKLAEQYIDEDSNLAKWRSYAIECQNLPPTLAAALVADTWDVLEPAPHMPWIGRMLAASFLRERGKSRWHMPCLNEGLKTIERERRRNPRPDIRLLAQLDAMAAAATTGLSQHDRWVTARDLLARKIHGRRSTSSLPELVDYVLKQPLISAKMIAAELDITPRAAQDLVATLGLRELTGRRRYRAWGVL